MSGRQRFDVVDVARGLALVAMAGYHLTWDLAYFGVAAPETPFTPPMRIASHVIGGFFLGLAGFSMALASANGFRARPFWMRLARVGAAAALVTAASYAMAPQYVIGFGILHCIFVASLIAAPLSASKRGGLVALALGLALVVLPSVFASPTFNPPWLVWLGFGTQEPPTLDWRPLAPWGGVVLLGLALGRLRPPLPTGAARLPPTRALAFAGRHSLAIYLIHQPILFALLYGALHVSGYSETVAVEAYRKACRPACVEAGGEIDVCERACACVVRGAKAAGLAGRLASSDSVSKDERARLGGIVDACGSEAR